MEESNICEHGYNEYEEAKCPECILRCDSCNHSDGEHVHPELVERDPFERRTPCYCRDCFII
jgi:hypothetical protein